MQVDFQIRYNKELERFEFKDRGGYHLMYQEARKILEGLDVIISASLENEYESYFNQIDKVNFFMEVRIYLNLTDGGWRIYEISKGECEGFRALPFQECALIKKLLQQRFDGIEDEGLSIAKENAEVEFGRFYSNPHVVKRPINHEKNPWTICCSLCKCKVKSTDINEWWAVSYEGTMRTKKYCSEICANKVLENTILNEKAWHLSRILEKYGS